MSNSILHRKINIKKTFLWTAVFLMCLDFVYSRVNMPFEQNELFTDTFVTASKNDLISNFLKLASSACFLLVAFFSAVKIMNIRKTRIENVCVLILFVFGIFWTIDALIGGNSIFVLNTNSASPMIMFMALCVYIGFDDELFDSTMQIVFVVGLFFTVISFYETIRFVSLFGFSERLMTSSAVSALVDSCILMYINLFFNTKMILNRKIIFAVQIVILTFVSLILQSRSWLVHSVFQLLILIYKDTNNSKVKWLKRSAIVIGIFIAVVLLWDKILVVSEGLVNRIDTDSRTKQLNDFFSQITFKDMLWGTGLNGSYRCFGREYFFLDNIVLLTIFKYGILPELAYLTLCIIPLIYGIKHKNSQIRGYVLFLLVWLAMNLGFAIYISYSITIYNIVVYILFGRMFFIMRQERKEAL